MSTENEKTRSPLEFDKRWVQELKNGYLIFSYNSEYEIMEISIRQKDGPPPSWFITKPPKGFIEELEKLVNDE